MPLAPVAVDRVETGDEVVLRLGLVDIGPPPSPSLVDAYHQVGIYTGRTLKRRKVRYAVSADAARAAYAIFERAWAKRCPGAVASLREGGDELLTFFTFPKTQ